MVLRACTRQSGGLRQLGTKGKLKIWKPLNHKCSSSRSVQQWSTPLAKNIADGISTTGPISIAAYMRQCLTSPDGGYYTKGKDPFGQKGDFITSPEISQIFGELLGIWMVAEWIAQGKISQGVEIIELGPGRGTLMDDMLRTLNNFDPLASAIEQIYLVEASHTLRESQRKLLCGDSPLERIEIGFRSRSKYSNLPIVWCEDIRFVPNDPSKTPFIFAHEFFDALPIHAFQSVKPPPAIAGLKPIPQWRELVVTPTPSNTTNITTSPFSAVSSTPEFQLSLSKKPTTASLLLPTSSPRYAALLTTSSALIEISPESHIYAANIASRIGGTKLSAMKSKTTQPINPKPKPSGAALILDYGPTDTIPTSTLRGIRNHTLCSPFLSPGQVDISADVDFTALAEAALAASDGVEVHGTVEQGAWLEAMGARERAEMICSSLKKGMGGEEMEKQVRKGLGRLLERGGGGMGKIYKVMAILPENGGRRRPVGFGGDVEVEQ